MSLDVYLKHTQPVTVHHGNITHNLNRMAAEAGIYAALWRPEELGIERASELVPLLNEGLAKLEADPAHFRQFDAPNGYGTYDNLVRFVRNYLSACREHPDATVRASR